MRKKREPNIIVISYNQIEYWHDRKTAMEFYRECMDGCEGCEKERYTNVFLDLLDGLNICHDGMSDSYEALEEQNRVLNIPSPDGTRDFGGKIWYPKWD